MNPIVKRPGVAPIHHAPRPVSLAIGLAVLSGAVLAGCTSPTPPPPPTYADQVCTTVAQQILPAADPQRVGHRDEYGELPNLLNGQSLYFTSWGTRLAAAIEAFPAIVDKDATLDWLMKQVLAVSSGEARLESSKADTVRQALLGIVALGGKPTVTGDIYADLRTGWGYSANPGDAPSEGATLMVFQGLEAFGENPPADVVDHLGRQAAVFRPDDDLESITNRELPTLQALAIALSPDDLRRTVPNLETLIVQWSRATAESEISGLQLANLVALSDVADAAGLTAAEVDAAKWAPLRTPGGLWALAPGSAGDPQVTLLAVDLGIASAESVAASLDGGASRAGWYSTIGDPSHSALYKVSAIKYLCGYPMTAPGPLLSRWTSATLASADADALAIYQVCTLHRLFANRLSDADSASLAARARTLAEDSKDPTSMAQAFLAMKACGDDELPKTSVVSSISVTDLTSLSAYSLHVLDGLPGTEGFGYRAFLEATRVGTLHSAGLDVPTADVYSTGLALDYLEASPVDRQQALQQFAVDGAWSQMPKTADAASPSATLTSLLMATIVATGGSDDVSPLMVW